MSLNRKWMASPNCSSRSGSGVRLIVVHTAEGAPTIESLGNYFANPAAEVSSHTGADDQQGVIGEYVKRPDKAWTAANANPYSIQIELCGFAAWDRAEWERHPNMLENCRLWIAEEAAYFNIPIRKIDESQAAAGQAGVCGHADLGYANNDHWDPGSGFPWDIVIGDGPTLEPPQPILEPEEADMLLAEPFKFGGMHQSFYVTKSFGELWHKWSSNKGQSWHSEVLMGPGTQKPGYVQTAKLIEVSSFADDDVAIVLVYAEDNQVWQCRQERGQTTWDRRRL